MPFYKNRAGQPVKVNIRKLTDNTPLTSGTTTVYMTPDSGTQQNLGSAIHAGNGEWYFVPEASSFNYNFPSFTFVNPEGVAQTLNIPTVPTYAEPSSIPTTGATPEEVGFFTSVAVKNSIQFNKTSGVRKIMNDVNSTGLFQSTESDDGTTYTSGPLVLAS